MAEMNVLDEKIEALKRKFKTRHVHVATVQVDGEDKEYFFREPTRDEMRLILPMSVKDPVGAAETTLETLLIEGDRELLEADAGVFATLMSVTERLLGLKAYALKKY